jgi:hypothetical protein
VDLHRTWSRYHEHVPLEKTDSNAPEILGNGDNGIDPESLTDRALLLYVQQQLGELGKRLEHRDAMIHEVHQGMQTVSALLAKYQPLLDRFADPGAAVRAFLPGARKHPRGGKPGG